MPPPPESPAAGAPAAGGATRPPRRPGRFARWVRKPSTAIALLGVAVVVGVVQGQPPPASRDSGVSVPVRDSATAVPTDRSYTRSGGSLLVVVDGAVVRYDTATDRSARVPLPRGVTALRAWNQDGRVVVLGRIGNGRTVAYELAGGTARYLGATELLVPSADRTAVWLVTRRVATRVPLVGAGPRLRVPLPPSSRLVGETPYGLVVSTGTVPDPTLPESRRPTPTPTVPTPTVPSPTVPTPTLPSGTPPGPTGTVSASAGGTPSVPPPSLAPVPTTPPYTTASPVPSTGPDGVPLTTLVVALDGRTRFLAAAEALAATGDVVLIRDDERRLGIVSPAAGVRLPRLLPKLNAIEAIGPGTLDARGETFAVLGRTNDYAWLMVGPTSAETNGAINVVALDGGAPVEGAAAPAFTASGRVLTVRPDGRVVYYAPGERDGFTLADRLPPATSVAQA